ncbi:GTPase HflX [Candidatus Parcubacteria bacterium]|nr:GTPase HflX [Candidatus Parcubacteria bacterium]
MLKAILIDLIHPRMLRDHALERLGEVEELVNTYGGIVVVKTWQKRFAPHPKTYIGTGKVRALCDETRTLGANLVIINGELKPRQTFEIGEALRKQKVEVWDRIDLILKIFAKHARTTEARLEIELASVRHMGPRIFGMGMELSRQAGGIGTVGIGETNIERMKRHLREKERSIKQKLEKYERGRGLQRAARRRANLKTVAIVGYTNAGKTTLLNALTGRREYAAEKLFATLDTRVGQLYLPGSGKLALVSDTIGFIKRLPPELLNAFASTLSEAVDADALIHLADGSDPHVFGHLHVVEEILQRLGVAGTPRLLVLNKADRVDAARRASVDEQLAEIPHIWVSAETKQGLEALVDHVERELA